MKENITHRSTFAIIFILNRSKMKKNGMCPILGRISVDAKAVQFSIKIDSAPNQWDAKVGRVIGDNEKNKHLTKLDNRVRDLHAEILSQQGYVTADLIKNGLSSNKELSIFRINTSKYCWRAVPLNRRLNMRVRITLQRFQ